MEKKLLTEKAEFYFTVDKNTLTESITEEGTNNLILKGVTCTVLDKKNANGRIYSSKEMEKALETAKNRGLFETRRLHCTADDHPEGSYVKPTHSSHIAINAYIKECNGEKYLLNDWLILNTDNGRNLKALIEANAAIGTSIRGLGRLNEKTSEVEEYEYLGTDAVGNPSAGTFATPNDFKVEVTEEVASKNTHDLKVINEGKKMTFDLTKELDNFKSKYIVEGKVAETTDKKVVISDLMTIKTEALKENLDISEIEKVLDIVLGEAINVKKEEKEYKKEQTQDVINKSDRHIAEASKILANEAIKEKVELQKRIEAMTADAEQYKTSSKEQVKKIEEEKNSEIEKLKEEKNSLIEEHTKKLKEYEEAGVNSAEDIINKSVLATESLINKFIDIMTEEKEKDIKKLSTYMEVTDKAMDKKENIERQLIASIAIIECLQKELHKSFNESEDGDFEIYEDFNTKMESKHKSKLGEAVNLPVGWR